jgi:hypothetical protein
VSCIGPDKVSDDIQYCATCIQIAFKHVYTPQYDYELMGTLTGNTAGSLKKMWPPVKKKAIEAHGSFAAFLGITGANITAAPADAKAAPAKAAAAPKATGGRKKKNAATPEGDADGEVKGETETKPAAAGRKKKAAATSDEDVETKPAAAAGRKRKAGATSEVEEDADVKPEPEIEDEPKIAGTRSRSASRKPEPKKAAPAKAKGRAKKVKKEEVSDEMVKDEEEAQDGEPMGKFITVTCKSLRLTKRRHHQGGRGGTGGGLGALCAASHMKAIFFLGIQMAG